MLGDWTDDRARLFKDNDDRERLIDRLADRVEQYNIRLFQYCLMLNHFHLVLETPEGNLSRFMHSLTTAYTVCFNLRHRRHGHLVDGRFKAKLVEGDKYLLALTRYVHQNPVCVGTLKRRPISDRIRLLREYEWSTYQSYIGMARPLDFVEYAPILGLMHGRKGERPGRYRKYVETGLADDGQDFRAALIESPRSIGSARFHSWVDGLYEEVVEGCRHPEDASFRHVTEPQDVEEVMGVVAEVFGVGVGDLKQRRRNSVLRAVAARFLCRYAGLTQREAAARLGIGTGSAISRQMKRFSDRLSEDPGLQCRIGKVEQRLTEARRAQNHHFVKY